MLKIPIGGITPFSTLDWPDRLSAVLYARGCPWRCPYCHNPEFQIVTGPFHPWEGILGFLEDRRGFLDGVVFSGGEPTLHPDLELALGLVRELGFGTALHTGGNYPQRLHAILESGLVDWVGFDVKAPFDDYALITGVPGSGRRVRRSLGMLVASGIPYEIRTTMYTPLLSPERLKAMARDVGEMGGGNLVLQRCLEAGGQPVPDAPDLATMAASIRSVVGKVAVRDQLAA